LRRYPDVEPLTAAFADRFGVSRDMVLVTAGADEALDRCCRLLLGPGIELVFPEPGFAMTRRYAALAGADIVSVPWTEGPYPTDAVLAAVTERTGAIVFTSPNNPTGLIGTEDDLRRLATAGVPRIVDLAYAEFADADLTAIALAAPGTIVLRTMSKA